MKATTPEVARLAWLWLVGGLALVMAPHLLRLPPWLGLLCVAAIGWRLLRDVRGWALPGPWLRLILTLGGIGAVLAAYGTLVGPDAGVALLAVMLSLKLVEMRGLRDATVVVLLAYFLVATGFLFSQSIASGLYLLVAVVVLTAALVVLNHPAAEARLARQYLRRAVDLLMQAVPLMVLLFVLFPRLSGSLWGIAIPEQGARTGLSEDMSVGDVSRLAESDEVAFRVEFAGPVPAADKMYWRGPVLWHTDGRRWTALSPEGARHLEAPMVETRGTPVDYSITLEPHGRQWLFVLDLPGALPEQAVFTPDLQVLARTPVDQLRRYQARSFPQARMVGLDPAQRALALSLPPHRHPRARTLAEGWVSEGAGEAERVQRALTLFGEQDFYYSMQPPKLGADPVDEFLFDTRTGFCEHYAASFVVLMRAAGVPARVVTGYQGGEFNPLGGHLIVRQSDAHAWAEVYLSGRGWVRVDPTMAIPPQRIAAGANRPGGQRATETGLNASWLGKALKGVRQLADATDHGWNQWVLGYSADKQRRLLERLGVGSKDWRTLVALLGTGAVLILAGVAAHVAWRRRQAADPVARSFHRVLKRLARVGLVKSPSEGALAFAARVAEANGELGARFSEVARRYSFLRYGPPPSRAELKAFWRLARTFRP